MESLMSRWRILLVLFLLIVPFVFLAVVGSYYLWTEGWGWFIWWPMVACLIVGYVLAWYWQSKKLLLKPVDFTPPLYWTDRDQHAWRLVQTRAAQAIKVDPKRLTQFPFYTDTAQEMALELARFYHPETRDPIANLTFPEILAVVELVASDMADLVDNYLPGGHLLTIDHWRRAKQVHDWYKLARQFYWIASTIFSPIDAGMRYVTSELGMSRPLQMLQQDLVAWFVTAYIHRLGVYLIDLNSGRLRVGARRFRELQASTKTASTTTDREPAAPAEDPATPQITIAVMGQVKAGKSSLINALLGHASGVASAPRAQQQASTDVLPLTDTVTRYELQPEGVLTRLVLLDTIGYGHEGWTKDQERTTAGAAQQSDLVLLLLHARNPARQADLAMLQHFHAWFNARPDLKKPPVLGVLTHIDLLSPAMEWAPPYNWSEPLRPKEHQIHDAWSALKEQLGQHLVGIVPVCTAPERVYGIEEWLLPTIAELLNEAQAVAMLRTLRAERDTGLIARVFRQAFQASKVGGQILWSRLQNQSPTASQSDAVSRSKPD
jgi:predicted GTPase